MKTQFFIALFVVIAMSPSAHAIPSQCTEASDSYPEFLYKSSNVHGGRGGSLIVNLCRAIATSTKPNRQSLIVLAEDGTVIGKFGRWDEGHTPYGARFYLRYTPGASNTSVTTLKARALAHNNGNGKPYAYVRLRHPGKCFRINNPTSPRQDKGGFHPVFNRVGICR